MTVQPPIKDDLMASILEKNTIEFSAQQEWENEWNQAGLASRLSEQVFICFLQFINSFLLNCYRSIDRGRSRDFKSVLPNSCDKEYKLLSKVVNLVPPPLAVVLAAILSSF